MVTVITMMVTVMRNYQRFYDCDNDNGTWDGDVNGTVSNGNGNYSDDDSNYNNDHSTISYYVTDTYNNNNDSDVNSINHGNDVCYDYGNENLCNSLPFVWL